jgi:hypothetical protein
MPRTTAGGRTVYDDPAGPVFDIVEVDPPSIWEMPSRTSAEVRIVRDYVQDYLTLRGMALFEVFFAVRRGDEDDDTIQALDGKSTVEYSFPDRNIILNRIFDKGVPRITAQVWGARLLATPGGMPITEDPLDAVGLNWPGIDEPVTHAIASRLRMNDYVYVNDAVLGAYEGVEGFDIFPESGSVGFGTQWGVGFCDRVGRDTIRLELRKLYEGAPSAVIRQWNRHAILATGPLSAPQAINERNIATRAREIVQRLAAMGARLSDLAEKCGFAGTSPESFVGLDQADLEYRGWWAPERVRPITWHVPGDMNREGFLRRCVAMNSLITEQLGQAAMRSMLTSLGVPPKELEGFKGLKLLDLIVRLCQVSLSTGYKLPAQAQAIREELKSSGTVPARPMEHLFALYDLRIVGAHGIGDIQRELAERLARFGVEPSDYEGGFGGVLDRVYDNVAKELDDVLRTLTKVVDDRS